MIYLYQNNTFNIRIYLSITDNNIYIYIYITYMDHNNIHNAHSFLYEKLIIILPLRYHQHQDDHQEKFLLPLFVYKVYLYINIH